MDALLFSCNFKFQSNSEIWLNFNSQTLSNMNYTVYVLYSEAFDKHYTGYTSDLEQRLISHNEFGNEWTARYRP